MPRMISCSDDDFAEIAEAIHAEDARVAVQWRCFQAG